MTWTLYSLADSEEPRRVRRFESKTEAWDYRLWLCEERARRCLSNCCNGPGCDTSAARAVLTNGCLLEYEIVEESML